MSRVNQIVKREYSTYCQLFDKVKYAYPDVISLYADKKHNPNWSKGEFEMKCLNRPGKIKVQQKHVKKSIYAVVLLIETFMTEAICRFDSDGHMHINKHRRDYTELEERLVPTPHFHRWDENGYEIAYTTPDVIGCAKAIHADINVGLYHVCQQFSIFTLNEEPIQVATYELFPSVSLKDNNKGIDFDV
ncbi:hypothetical protein DYU11_20240 [Fibrisoma montanum]|uniref:Uncharacterized protein n=1 Tax=Fibrisoma montanum TaxID=2305895 RepID=A0A418M401_9BACT|nr:hypothetical protein [Fibrisoma montanum]RIV20383.1 hypothetical protein DYU11_20240 [Fibrisoma montanum]